MRQLYALAVGVLCLPALVAQTAPNAGSAPDRAAQQEQPKLPEILVDEGESNAQLHRADALYTQFQENAESDEARAQMQEALADALVGLQDVLPRDPDDPVAVKFYRLLADVGKKENPPESAKEAYTRMLAAADAGQCELTERLGAEILSQAPKFAYADIVRGDCYFYNRNWTEALKRYEEAAQADPDYGRAYERIAECQDNLDQQSEALESYIRSVIVSPGSNALSESLADYAYKHSYKVLLNRVQPMARVAANSDGDLVVVLKQASGMSTDVSTAWVTFALKKMLLYVQANKRDPSVGLTPSFEIDRGSYETLLDYWTEAKQKDPQLHDEELDFLLELRRENLLDAFVYVANFRPEFEDTYAKWRTGHEAEMRTLFEKYLVLVDPNQVKFKEGLALFADSKYEEALAAFQASARGFIGSRDPGIRELLARDLNFIGRTTRILGHTEDALTYETQAAAMLHELDSPQQEANVRNSMALTLTELGRVDEALNSFQAALALDRARHDVKAEAAVLTNLGNFYLTRGEIDKAQAVLDEAMTKAAGRQDIPLAALYSNLGTVASDKGRYKEAVDDYEKGVAAAKAEHDPLNENVLNGNLGNLELSLGQYESGKRHFDDALALSRSLKDRASEAADLNNLGGVLMQMGDLDGAFHALLDSYTIKKEIGNRSEEATALTNLGGLSSEMGNKSQALQFWQEALEIARELGQRDQEATILNNIGGSLDDPKEALANFEEALALTSAKPLVATPENPYPVPRREDILNSRDAREVLGNMGVVLYQAADKARQSGRSAEEEKDLKGAVSSLSLSVDLVEEAREGARPTDFATQAVQVSFLAQHFGIYETLVGAALRLNELEPEQHWDLEAFKYAERSKARSLLELLNQSKAKSFSGVAAEELAAERQYELRIGALDVEVATASEGAREALRRELDETQAGFEEFKKHLRAMYPQYAALKYAEPTPVSQVQASLDRQTALIECFVGYDYIAVWVVKNDSIRVHTLWDAKPILASVADYQQTLTETARPLNPEEGRKLYSVLLGPMEGSLQGITRLIVVPDGELYKLPLEALVYGMDGARPLYLVERYAISYAPSSSVLVSLLQRAAPPASRKPLFAMGRPVYARLPVVGAEPHTPVQVAAAANRRPEVPDDLYSYYLGTRTLADLPATEEEVDKIGAILKSSDDVFTHQMATESRVKDYSNRGLLKQFQYVHFATHGLVSDEVPALTSVVLAQDKDRQDDGFLTVGEVYGLELDSDMVTLSACGLGLGKMERGEGVIGLTRAFLYAGTRAVTVSLWSVSDTATAELMEQFYQNLAAGMDRGRALQQAQIAMIRQARMQTAGPGRGFKRYRTAVRAAPDHPFYWAPFVLYGAW
jgi:CHAT domain-containing protein/Tfp pilus assembly protein PilF